MSGSGSTLLRDVARQLRALYPGTAAYLDVVAETPRTMEDARALLDVLGPGPRAALSASTLAKIDHGVSLDLGNAP